ncbi:MAG: molybdenum cofactor biosynthesis protein MoeB [Proteobacteria bacterium]|nr:MAG: molybdenum cofactor biosynthesis protein MoeB [Pseudomonadota bacterium]
MSLTEKELSYYARQLRLEGFGPEAQLMLKRSKVLVVGVGGLGCPALQYLCAAGVGTLGFIDFDSVQESNLHRQILFGVGELGLPKVEAALRQLSNSNPYVRLLPFEERLSPQNAAEIIGEFDLVIDGSDNFATRFLVNDSCVVLAKPFVAASIAGFEGQISVYNCLQPDGSRGPTYRCLFPEPPPPGAVPSCAEAGVLGILPGILGIIQANEAIKVLTRIGEPLAGKLLVINALDLSTRMVRFSRNEEAIKQTAIQEDYPDERFHIGGEFIPMDQIGAKADLIPRDRMVVVYCHSGQRSAYIVHELQVQLGFENLFNLQGGVQSWRLEEIST